MTNYLRKIVLFNVALLAVFCLGKALQDSDPFYLFPLALMVWIGVRLWKAIP